MRLFVKTHGDDENARVRVIFVTVCFIRVISAGHEAIFRVENIGAVARARHPKAERFFGEKFRIGEIEWILLIAIGQAVH